MKAFSSPSKQNWHTQLNCRMICLWLQNVSIDGSNRWHVYTHLTCRPFRILPMLFSHRSFETNIKRRETISGFSYLAVLWCPSEWCLLNSCALAWLSSSPQDCFYLADAPVDKAGIILASSYLPVSFVIAECQCTERWIMECNTIDMNAHKRLIVHKVWALWCW